MVSIGILSQKNEGSEPGSYNPGTGDAGGASYGTYQFATKAGTVAEFIAWLQARDDYGRDYGNKLAQFEPDTKKFKEAWIELADTDEKGFGALQDAFVMLEYYGVRQIVQGSVVSTLTTYRKPSNAFCSAMRFSTARLRRRICWLIPTIQIRPCGFTTSTKQKLMIRTGSAARRTSV